MDPTIQSALIAAAGVVLGGVLTAANGALTEWLRGRKQTLEERRRLEMEILASRLAAQSATMGQYITVAVNGFAGTCWGSSPSARGTQFASASD
jgi:hypothetical protein